MAAQMGAAPPGTTIPALTDCESVSERGRARAQGTQAKYHHSISSALSIILNVPEMRRLVEERERVRETWIDQYAVYLVCNLLPLWSFARTPYLTYAMMPQRLAEEADVITGGGEAAVSFSVGLVNYPHVKFFFPAVCARLCVLSYRTQGMDSAVARAFSLALVPK